MQDGLSIIVSGIKDYNDGTSGNKVIIGYGSDDFTKEDFLCLDKIILEFYSPIPDSDRIKFRVNHVDYSIPRLFAEVTLKKVEKDFFLSLLNPDKMFNVAEYREKFEPYIETVDGQLHVKDEYLTRDFENPDKDKKYLNFCMLISEYKRVYTDSNIERNKRKSTYATNPATFRPLAVDEEDPFERARVLSEEWTNALKNIQESERYGMPIGKKVRLLYREAPSKLFTFVERKLKALGFHMIFLQADTMSLAVKVYSGAEYYPLWEKDNKKDEHGIILDGGKLQEVVTTPGINIVSPGVRDSLARLPETIRRKINCDSSSGPHMFKIIQDGNANPDYDWASDRAFCRAIPAPPAPAPPAPAPPAPAPPAPAAAAALIDVAALNPYQLATVNRLSEMGYTMQQISRAVGEVGWNPNRILDRLLRGNIQGGKRKYNKTHKGKKKNKKTRKQKK